MSSLPTRLKTLIEQLQHNIYEKDTEVALALLAALAGESVLLLGPPGIAKSMIARRLKTAFAQAKSFEYLMSRFSTPDEIFGPVSIAKLKKSDKYERAIEGYLPTADVVFLDEIWKAGPAIQNTLLTVMNEKLFRNGNQEMKLPLKLLVAASNELPAKGEGLEALWDRFLIRIVCRNIQDEDVFRKMLTEVSEEGDTEAKFILPETLTIHPQEYQECQAAASRVEIPQNVLEAITYIRLHLQQVKLTASELPRNIYVSDRRWKHIARLLRTSAYLQGRSEVDSADLLPMYHCLWNEPEEVDTVRKITLHALFDVVRKKLATLAASVKADLEALQAKEALAKALREHDHRDEDLVIARGAFYQIENHGTGHTYIFITHFKQLPTRNFAERQGHHLPGIIYTDPQNPKRKLIRLVTEETQGDFENMERVTLCRDDQRIFINGMAYQMRRKGSALKNPQEGKMGSLFDVPLENLTEKDGNPFATHYEEDIENICVAIDRLKAAIKENIFCSPEDIDMAEAYAKTFYRQIALTRVDIRKLLYNDD